MESQNLLACDDDDETWDGNSYHDSKDNSDVGVAAHIMGTGKSALNILTPEDDAFNRDELCTVKKRLRLSRQ
jgi:hypothetical protein